MKPILYAGAVLMTAASIYGFVDYKKSSSSLSTLYETKEVVASPIDASVEIEQKVITEKQIDPAKTLIPVAKKSNLPASAKEAKDEIKLKEPDEASAAPEITKFDLSPENVTIYKNNVDNKNAAAKKRKVNYKMYSRGALDERIIEKEKQRKEQGMKVIKKEE